MRVIYTARGVISFKKILDPVLITETAVMNGAQYFVYSANKDPLYYTVEHEQYYEQKHLLKIYILLRFTRLTLHSRVKGDDLKIYT